MTRIAVLGANGQVGAEVCLLLANHPGVELIPICRNRAGSAFLRYHGLACRHGLAADETQAPALFGDCDLLVHAAVAAGTPRQSHAREAVLIRNLLRFTPPHARLVYLSTLMVHGDPRPHAWPRWRDAYGRLKHRSERLLSRGVRRRAQEAYVLRLGHVCGELQGLTRLLRQRLREGQAPFPDEGGASNTLYTATLADALLRILAGQVRPGTYDLVNYPEWSWRQVYEYEAEQCGLARHPETAAGPSPAGAARTSLGAFLRAATRLPLLEGAARRALTLAPAGWNDRAQAAWYCARARREIDTLSASAEPPVPLHWRPLGRVFLPGLRPTRELLAEPAFRLPPREPARAWPADLPPANAQPAPAQEPDSAFKAV